MLKCMRQHLENLDIRLRHQWKVDNIALVEWEAGARMQSGAAELLNRTQAITAGMQSISTAYVWLLGYQVVELLGGGAL